MLLAAVPRLAMSRTPMPKSWRRPRRSAELRRGGVPAVLTVASVQMAPLISFTTKVGKLHSPLILIDQTKAGQIGHVARQQMFRLRNTKGDASQGDFLMRTEWCPKTTIHGLPPKLTFGGKAWAQIGRESPLCPFADCWLALRHLSPGWAFPYYSVASPMHAPARPPVGQARPGLLLRRGPFYLCR
jgi:hypothetical protein